MISYSVPTSTGIMKLHAAVEMLGGVHQLPTCHLGGSSNQCETHMCDDACQQQGQNIGPDYWRASWNVMLRCCGAFRPECDGHMPFLTYYMWLDLYGCVYWFGRRVAGTGWTPRSDNIAGVTEQGVFYRQWFETRFKQQIKFNRK